MITKQALEDLIVAASTVDNDEAVLKLLDSLDEVEPGALKDAASNFEALFETWDANSTMSDSDDKAKLCAHLAEKSVLDNAIFRNALNSAVKRLLPPYIASASVVKAIGARDESVSPREAALRLKKLQHLRSTALVYQIESHTWCKISNIDKVTATMALSSLETGSISSMPIASALLGVHFFDTTPEMLNLLYPGKTSFRSSSEYRRAFAKYCLVEISDNKIEDIIQHLMVPMIMSQDAFTAWWNNQTAAVAVAPGKRAFWDARSVLELYTLLKPFADQGHAEVSEPAAESLGKLFTKLRAVGTPKDISMLAESISWLSGSNPKDSVLSAMFEPLRGKAPFWPQEINSEIPLKQIELWGQLSVKLLPGFVHATSFLYSNDEIAQFSLILPLRCLTVVYDFLPSDTVTALLMKTPKYSADMVMWVWKNRSKLSRYLTSNLDMEHVVDGLSVENLPKEWTSAQRELKKQLFEKADFQRYVINNADGDIPSIIGALQKYRNYQPGEQQSIMVKLSRHSDELKAYIEGGEGRKLMGAKGTAAAIDQHAPLTSLRSHRRLVEELEDLIKVQIPQNAAAVALARSFGDLRENAEYDAAKERRRFLHRRRSELEKTLSFIEGTDFKNVVLKDTVVLGCQVKLESASGAKKEYYVLGAWDGDPEKNRISYKTKIGEALVGKKIGQSVQIPEAGSFTIKTVLPLPADMVSELADETK